MGGKGGREMTNPPFSSSSPVDLIDSSPYRLTYCVVMALWAANVSRDLFDQDLHYHDPSNAVLNAAKFYGK